MAEKQRQPSTLEKLDRLNKTLRHEEPDRVPITDFFWGGFLKRWRSELGLAGDADPYTHYDLDWTVTIPNMDPHIRAFETIQESKNEVWVKTGFETVLRKRLDLPMPEQMSWGTDTIEKLESFTFDDPGDRRRLFEAGDNQIAGVGDGFVIWGDVAYKQGMFFSPTYWREYFKPWVRGMVEYCHAHGLPVVYHGCGCVKEIFEDYIEIGVDAYNPLEAKAGMDVLDLRRRYGHRMAFAGNIDIRKLERGDEVEIRREILRKLNAAKGGGFIVQSDHSVPSDVSGKTYDYLVKLVREYGKYPLELQDLDEAF